MRLVDEQSDTILVNRSRTLGPHRANETEPSIQLLPKLSRPSILSTSELADQAEVSEKRHALFPRAVKQR